jgi:hypothetical protein
MFGAKNMRQYKNIGDALFGLVLLLGSFICFLMITSTIAYLYPDFGRGPFSLLRYLAPYFALIIISQIARHQLLRSKVPTLSYILLFACAIAAMWRSFGWFSGFMHDFALLLGSHGRWGCGAVNADGSPYYVIRDATVPWLIFTPLAVACVGHWVWARKRTTEPTDAAAASRGS